MKLVKIHSILVFTILIFLTTACKQSKSYTKNFTFDDLIEISLLNSNEVGTFMNQIDERWKKVNNIDKAWMFKDGNEGSMLFLTSKTFMTYRTTIKEKEIAFENSLKKLGATAKENNINNKKITTYKFDKYQIDKEALSSGSTLAVEFTIHFYVTK